MEKITHPIYKDYPEQPYISPERDLIAWEKYPERFHYGIIHKRDMIRVEEGLLPGDIIMLWRIGFNTFTNESTIPQYFEYRYGVNSEASIALLLKLGFASVAGVIDSLDLLTTPQLKRILKDRGLAVSGKKGDLLQRVVTNIPQETLAKLFSIRRYQITDAGKAILKKYDAIIQRHGPKM